MIAGDTEVVVDGRALGQPGFEGEARWCLETLSGRTHEVLGALALSMPPFGTLEAAPDLR